VFWALPVLWLWSRLEAAGAPARKAAAARQAPWLALCGLLFVGDLVFWHWSILRTTVANATLFANFSPLVVTLGAWHILKQRVTPRFLAGMAVALAGAGLLVGASFEIDLRHVLGDALGLVTAVFFGCYVIAVAALRRHLPASTIMFWSSAVTCAGLAIAASMAEDTLLPASARGWTVLVALAWVSQAAGQGMIAYALGHLPAAFSSLVILVEPLTAAVLGWIILAEPLTILQTVGAVAILAGILIARRANEHAST
jgi:drug/metabolite transporter (DMT)-like permease